VDLVSQLGDRPAARGIPDHQILCPVHPRVDVIAVQEPGRELRVVAGPPEVEHEQARHLDGHQRSRQLRDQVQRQVHAGRDAGAGEDVPIADEDPVLHDLEPRELAGEPVRERVVGGAGVVLEQSALGGQEGARADGAEELLGPHGTRQPGRRPSRLG